MTCFLISLLMYNFSVTAMGGAQTQFYELFLHGISFVADPKQMVFTNNEKKTVDGLLNGDFEIGFVRTDQIERQTDANGKTLDPGMFSFVELASILGLASPHVSPFPTFCNHRRSVQGDQYTDARFG